MMFDEALKSFYEVLVIGEAVCLRNPVELLSYADCNFVVQSFFIDLGFFEFQQVWCPILHEILVRDGAIAK